MILWKPVALRHCRPLHCARPHTSHACSSPIGIPSVYTQEQLLLVFSNYIHDDPSIQVQYIQPFQSSALAHVIYHVITVLEWQSHMTSDGM